MIPSNPHRPWRQAVPFRPSRSERWAAIGTFAAAFLTIALWVVAGWLWLAILSAAQVTPR